VQTFYPEIKSFTKDENKFGWVKLANDIQFAKFAKDLPHQNFALYGSI